jgi:hypothetical protein
MPDLEFPGRVKVRLPATPRITMSPRRAAVAVVPVRGAAGPVGPQGPEGPQGEPGQDGEFVNWFGGDGPPTAQNTVGARLGDMYVDESSGTLYQLD